MGRYEERYLLLGGDAPGLWRPGNAMVGNYESPETPPCMWLSQVGR